MQDNIDEHTLAALDAWQQTIVDTGSRSDDCISNIRMALDVVSEVENPIAVWVDIAQWALCGAMSTEATPEDVITTFKASVARKRAHA